MWQNNQNISEQNFNLFHLICILFKLHLLCSKIDVRKNCFSYDEQSSLNRPKIGGKVNNPQFPSIPFLSKIFGIY